MINIKNVEFLIGIITLFLAYIISTTIANCFRAWVANKMGDSTAKNEGFLTLNPLIHIDPVGLLFLIFFHFGWGRNVPINPLNITRPLRVIKLIFAYLSETIAHFFLALISLILLIGIFDARILELTHYAMLGKNISYLYPTASSFFISLAFILVDLIYLNIILGLLHFIVNSCRLIMFFVVERSPKYAIYNIYITFLLPVLLILFFSQQLWFLVINFVSYLGYLIAQIFGIA